MSGELTDELRTARGPGNSYMEPDHTELMVRAADRIDLLESLLAELYDWAIDAASDGTGTDFGTDNWNNMCMSTWERADTLLPRVHAALPVAVADDDTYP